MYSYDEEKILKNEKEGVSSREATEKAVDEIYAKGFKNVFFIGIGGTYAAGLVAKVFVETNSALPFFLSNAGELIHMGNKNLTKDSVVFMESASGDTPEMVEALRLCKKIGARVYGYIENQDSPMAKEVDVQIFGGNAGYYKIYYFFGYMMKLWGDFADYDRMCKNLEHMPEAVIAAGKAMDPKAAEFAEKYCDAPISYFISAGNGWGPAYCLAMCYLEEMQWMVTKSIHAAEFFHGTLEVIEKGVSVVLFKGEDDSRAEVQRAEDFCRRVTNDVTVFDTKDYELAGIDEDMRGLLSSFIFHAVEERIFKNTENVNKHPGDIRRYYRRLVY